jgi:CheY-like chemotaxis protein
MSTPLRVLIVEDSEDNSLLLKNELARGGYEVTYSRVETAEAMRAALAEGSWDIVVSNHRMPQFSSLDALKLHKELQSDIPFIVVSGNMGEELAVGAMKAGAHDYITKDNLTRLLPAVERELREAESRRQRRRAELELEQCRRRTESTSEAAGEGICGLDARGVIDFIKPLGAKRVGWGAVANQVIPKAGAKPSLVMQTVEDALADPPLPGASPTRMPSKAEFDPVVRKAFLDSSSATLAALWRPLKQLAGQGCHPDNQTCFRELLGVVRPLTTTAASVGLEGIAQMSSALEALLQELCDAPCRLSPSALLTIAQAIDTLRSLFAYPHGRSAKHPSWARILVVDDDAFARQAVSGVLSRVNLRAICVDSPVCALKRRTGKGFDLIVLDIEMPDANGFDLCSRFRAMPACRNTPIIFLSMRKDLKDRTESVLRGGNDYITKPFLHMELATKVLSFVIGGPLKLAHPAWESNGNGSESAFSRRELNALKQVILDSYDA